MTMSNSSKLNKLEQRFCLSSIGAMRLMFSLFAVGFLSLVSFSFVLDWLYAYPMCEICLLQRFIMTMLGVVSVLGATLSDRSYGFGVACLVVSGLLLGLGLGFAASHLYMLSAAGSSGNAHACKIVAEMTFIPNFWYDFFHSRYAFVPCDQVTSGFLGVGFPMWSMLVYLVSGIAYAAAVCFTLGCYFDRDNVQAIKQTNAFHLLKGAVYFILVILFCVWMAASIYFVTLQRKILYKPDRYDQSHTAHMQQVDSIGYEISSGQQWAFGYPKREAATKQVKKDLWIVLWGRDAMALDSLFGDAGWASIFKRLSAHASFLLIDYPGFGMNAGFPTERSNRDSVLTAYQAWRKHHGIAEHEKVRVFVLAHSMGTGVAVDVARSMRDINGVVLLSPFVSIFQMSKVLLGSWMAWTVRPFLLDRYPTGHRLGLLHDQLPHLPVAIFHGADDEVIPVTHSQQMVHAHDWIQYYERSGHGHAKREFADERIVTVMTKMMQAQHRG